MKKLLFILATIVFTFSAHTQEKNELPYNKFEHLFYIDILGTNDLFHSYGYEFRYNPNKWMRIQTALGIAMSPEVSPSSFEFTMTPNVSLQFGKQWLWSELGFESSFNFSNPNPKFSAMAPRLGIHFKFTRVFEFGANYMPLYQYRDQGGQVYKLQHRGHTFSVRFRFIFISKKRKAELGVWKVTFKDDIPFESYEDRREKRRERMRRFLPRPPRVNRHF